jgi:hypothetical protein
MLFAVLSISSTTACGSDDGGQSVVIGQVTDVVSSSVTALAELEVIDANGALWRFEAHGFVGMTPSHLEEHGVLGTDVRVEYFEEDGRLVISEITDG